eukprot:5871064-Pyramimonas_sp.AAC.1
MCKSSFPLPRAPARLTVRFLATFVASRRARHWPPQGVSAVLSEAPVLPYSTWRKPPNRPAGNNYSSGLSTDGLRQ